MGWGDSRAPPERHAAVLPLVDVRQYEGRRGLADARRHVGALP